MLGAVFFTQNLFSIVPVHDLSLWSLNHEVVYYILAIPIIKYKPKPVFIFSGIFILLFISLTKIQFPSIVTGYLVGFLFWFSGYAVSKVKLNMNESTPINADKLTSLFFLLLACDILNPIHIDRITSKFHLLHTTSFVWLDDMVKISDLSGFPFCLYAIMTAGAINTKTYKMLTALVYSICWAYLAYLIANGSFFKINIFYLPALFLLLSTLLRFLTTHIFKSMSLWFKAGTISYALYVIHLPIMELIGKINFLRGTFLSFVIRLIVLFIIVIAISYLLEKVIQPRIKAFFTRKKTQLNTDTLKPDRVSI